VRYVVLRVVEFLGRVDGQQGNREDLKTREQRKLLFTPALALLCLVVNLPTSQASRTPPCPRLPF
jgi:hypothetical protein